MAMNGILVKDLCRELGLPVPRVRYWISSGRVPTPHTFGVTHFFTPEDADKVRAFARQHQPYRRYQNPTGSVI